MAIVMNVESSRGSKACTLKVCRRALLWQIFWDTDSAFIRIGGMLEPKSCFFLGGLGSFLILWFHYIRCPQGSWMIHAILDISTCRPAWRPMFNWHVHGTACSLISQLGSWVSWKNLQVQSSQTHTLSQVGRGTRASQSSFCTCVGLLVYMLNCYPWNMCAIGRLHQSRMLPSDKDKSSTHGGASMLER